jgi:hypothetical protein
MTLLAGDWFQSWETMAGAAVFILYVLGSIIGGKKKTPSQAPTAPRRAPAPPRPPTPLSTGRPGQPGPPRPPRAPTPTVAHAPPATSTLRPAAMPQQAQTPTHRDMPPPNAPRPAPPVRRAPQPPAAPQRRIAPASPAADAGPPRRRPGLMTEDESALTAHRPREVALPTEIGEERKLHEVSQEIEEERKAHRLMRDADPAARRAEELREKLVKVLRSRGGVRGAIMLNELISPPVALREHHLQ